MKPLQVSLPVWTDSNKVAVDCQVLFEEVGFSIPFTAVQSSSEPHVVKVFEMCLQQGIAEPEPIPTYEPSANVGQPTGTLNSTILGDVIE